MIPKYIDLHAHTNASDGTLTPTELIQLAKASELAAVAITDHDTMDGIEEAYQASRDIKLKFIPGVEMGAVYKEKEIHLLGYLLSPPGAPCILPSASIYQVLNKFARERESRNDEILRRLHADNIVLNKEDLYFSNPKAQITRAHFARLMVEKGYVKNIKTAFSNYLVYNGKYVPPKTTEVSKIMDFFNTNFFFSSLAHPLQYGFSNFELEELLLYLKKSGLCGIEVHHSTHTVADMMKVKKYSLKYSLCPTGGSDFHGENKPGVMLGKGCGGLKIPAALLKDMEKSFYKN